MCSVTTLLNEAGKLLDCESSSLSLDSKGQTHKRPMSISSLGEPQLKRSRFEKESSTTSSLSGDSERSSKSKGRVGFVVYNAMDVLSGRGGGTNLHPGNRHYRALILSHRCVYDEASKSKKPEVARRIVRMVRDRGGRFLRKDKSDGLYYDIGDELAREKTSQALRHRTFEMRWKDESKGSNQKLKSRKRLNPGSSASPKRPISPSSSGGVSTSTSIDMSGKELTMNSSPVKRAVPNDVLRGFGQTTALRGDVLQSLIAAHQRKTLFELDSSLRATEALHQVQRLPLALAPLRPTGFLQSAAPLHNITAQHLGLPTQHDDALLLHLAHRLGGASAHFSPSLFQSALGLNASTQSVKRQQTTMNK